MKKIVAIIGSPRKGETLKAVQRLEQEMQKHGEVEFEYVMLSQVALRDCTGCHNCILKGKETCREAEKVQALFDKMAAADAVVLASPVYNQGVTAIMKKFLDYFTYLWHRPALFGVKFIGVSSGGGMFKGTFQTMKENVSSWGGTWLGELGVPHYEALTEKFRAKADKAAVKKAAQFWAALGDKNLPKPTLGKLMGFRMWRMNAVFGEADRAHWTEKGWLDKKCRYYYDTKINPFANVLAAVLMGIARQVMRGIYVGY